MTSQHTHYGGGTGGNSGSTRLITHQLLGRTYWIGTSQSEAQLPAVDTLQVGTQIVFVLEAGRSKNTFIVYEVFSGGTIATLSNASAGGIAIIMTLTNNDPTAGPGLWDNRVVDLNSKSTSLGHTARADTMENTIIANARPTIATPFCGWWRLQRCSGDDIGNSSYTNQDLSTLEGKSIHLPWDPADTYRTVSKATGILITGPGETRDILSSYDEGPFDTCGPGFPSSCPYASVGEGPQLLTILPNIPASTAVANPPNGDDVLATAATWNEFGPESDLPLGTLGNLTLVKTGTCFWERTWSEVSTLNTLQFAGSTQATNSNPNLQWTLTLVSGQHWKLNLQHGIYSAAGGNNQGMRTEWWKAEGTSPVGTYVPGTGGVQALLAGTVEVIG